MEIALLLFYVIGLALTLLILYTVINRAVLNALEQHYKGIRWYEKTGEWAGKNPPRDLNAGPINTKLSKPPKIQ